MKIIAAVLPLSLFLIFSSAAYAKIDKYPCQVDGQVKNLTSNVAGSISLSIAKVDATHYRAKGNFDNKKLFGNFDVEGTLSISTSKDDTFKFAGEIDMGIEGSNIKSGTKAKYGDFVKSCVLTLFRRPLSLV